MDVFRRTCRMVGFLAMLLVLTITPAFAQDTLYEGFQSPPTQSRPFAGWCWDGSAVARGDILRELGIIRTAGFGGIEINPIAIPVQVVRLDKIALQGPDTFTGNIKDMTTPPATRLRPEDDTIAAPETVPGAELMFLRLVPRNVSNVSQCIDLTDSIEPNGAVTIDVPMGRYTLYVGSRQKNFPGAIHATGGVDGLDDAIVDYFDKASVEEYLNRISSALGLAVDGKPGTQPVTISCDGIELSGANWTAELPAEFKKRRGYDLDPYLHFVIDKDLPEANHKFLDSIRRARYDFSRTMAELFHERFITTFDKWCDDNGIQGRCRTYGQGRPMVMPAGEQPVGCQTLSDSPGPFFATCATLESIKQACDMSFLSGMNHFVLHDFINYSPPEAPSPDWIRCGTCLSEHNPLRQYFRYWTDYNARISHVLQQSRPVVEVAILSPTADAWSDHGPEPNPFIQQPDYQPRLRQAVQQNGASADYISETALQNATFDGGKLRSGSAQYDILLLAEVKSTQPRTARAILDFAKNGGRIVFIGQTPHRSCTMTNARQDDLAVRDTIQKALYTSTTSPNVGTAQAPTVDNLMAWTGALLDRFSVPRAVRIAEPDEKLFQIHHRLDQKEIYFFGNIHRDRAVTFKADFPTGDKIPRRWDPETGNSYVMPHGDKSNELQIVLAPLESLLLVFAPAQTGQPTTSSAPAYAPVVIDPNTFVRIDTGWELVLDPVDGRAFSRKIEKLIDLSKSDDPIFNTFGGTITYHTQFSIDDPSYHMLSLGRVHGLSHLRLNGRDLGIRWYGDHIYNTGGILQKGTNSLEIEVPVVLTNYCRSLRDNPATRGRRTERQYNESIGLLGPVRLHKTDQQ